MKRWIHCNLVIMFHAVFGSRLELPWWIQTTSWWSCWAVLSSIISSAQQTAERDTAERTLTRSAYLETSFSPITFLFTWFSLYLHSLLLPVMCVSLSVSQDVVQQNNTLIEEMLHLVIMIVGEWSFLNTRPLSFLIGVYWAY